MFPFKSIVKESVIQVSIIGHGKIMQKYKPLVVISAFRLSQWLREKSGRDQLSYDKRPICFTFLLLVSSVYKYNI